MVSILFPKKNIEGINAIDDEEAFPGIRFGAAPIRGLRGEIVAAMCDCPDWSGVNRQGAKIDTRTKNRRTMRTSLLLEE